MPTAADETFTRIDYLARVPRTGRGAVVYVGLVSMLAFAGMANSLAGVKIGGARQVECTFATVGEVGRELHRHPAVGHALAQQVDLGPQVGVERLAREQDAEGETP